MTRFLWLVLLAGCADRTHLYPTTGAASAAAFCQQANCGRPTTPLMMGPLDLEILLQNYRGASLRGGGASNGASAPAPMRTGDAAGSPAMLGPAPGDH
jgi:hypothetical protein